MEALESINKKLKEADHFYSRLLESEDNYEIFTYNLSAFLTAARSVLQFIFERVKGTPSQAWYNQSIANAKYIKYLKDKRDLNVHVEALAPKRAVTIHLQNAIRIKASMGMVVRDAKGNIKETRTESSDAAADVEDLPPKTTVLHRFKDWSDSEDIPTVCGEYLKEIRSILDDGISRMILS